MTYFVEKTEKKNNEEIEYLHTTLLDKKSEIKEIENIVENIIQDKMQSIKINKLKIILKMENNTIAMIFIGMIFGLLSVSFLSVILSLINGSFDILWGLLSTIISITCLPFLGSIFLKEFYSKNIEEKIRTKILLEEEVNAENLMRLNVFFDKIDKKNISDINEKNNGIHLIEIINILENKKDWIKKNEKYINEKMKVKYNREILESV